MAEQRDLVRKLRQRQRRSAQQHIAAGWFEQTRQHLEQSRLAGAVVAFHQHDLAGTQREVQRAEYRFVVARIGQRAHLQQRRYFGIDRFAHPRRCYPEAGNRATR
jgi:hypothetical protein